MLCRPCAWGGGNCISRISIRRWAVVPGGTGGKPAAYKEAEVPLSLFDLDSDIGETTDVKDQHPEVVATISKLADQMREDLGDSARNMKGSGKRPPGRLEPGDARFVVRDGQQTLSEPR